MKKNIFILIMVFLLALTLVSCKKEVEIAVSADFKEEMKVGETQIVKLNVEILKGKVKQLNTEWESLNPEILSVDKSGAVTALSSGKGTIKATVVANKIVKESLLEISVLRDSGTISYNLVGGTNSSENPTEFNSANLPIQLKPASKDGYEFVGWESDGQVITSITECVDYSLVAKWNAVEYTIEYKLDGGVLENAQEKYTIEDTIMLSEPKKDGYTFLGWYINDNKVESIKKGTKGNLELVAKWEKTPVYYNITFVLDGGKYESETTVPTHYQEGKGLSSLPNPVKEGFKFIGWYIGEQKYESISADQTGDLELTAKWEVNNDPIIVYDFNGGISEELYKEKGIVSASLTVTRFKGNFWGEYTSNVFVFNKSNDIKPTYSWRIYIGKDVNTGFYKIVGKVDDGHSTLWPDDAEYVITVSSQHNNASTYRSLFKKVSIGNVVILYGDLNKASEASVKVEFYDAEPAEKTLSVDSREVTELIAPVKLGYKFLGWYDSNNKKYESVSEITAYTKLTAKWESLTPVTDIKVEGLNERIPAGTNVQLNCSVVPSDAFFQEVFYASSDNNIFTVSETGLIATVNTGVATLTIKDYTGSVVKKYVITVYAKPHIVGNYESNSYLEVGETIELHAEVKEVEASIIWSSKDESIATVDQNGVVTAHKSGLVTIVATSSSDENLTMEFIVTVLSGEESEIVQYLLSQHNSNIYSTYDLGIGAGTPVYYTDIYGSVNKLLMNEFLKIDKTYLNLEVQNKTGDYFDSMTSIEFITVHYTGNMSSTANAKANADYFVDDNAVSIHYATGNDGVYAALPHDKGAWHAGDSSAYDVVGAFEWIPTGVAYKEGDPQYPDFSVSTDFYYEINGQKTKVPMARPWNYSNRGTDHTLNSDGTISSKSNFGGTGFTNRSPESFINDMELPFKIVDGEYYMGTTWWCYTQVYEGRICSTGGNRNSLGIESCVNKGSDLWYTWQKTAQLVAKLMLDNNLDITRVRGHHFFSGKDCPQPMLENNLEIWYEFLELVEAEYEMITTYKDYEITMVSNNPDLVDNKGRIISIPEYSTTVSYTITISKGGNVVDTITVASVIPGFYESV